MAKTKKAKAAFKEVVQIALLPEHEDAIVAYAADFEHIWKSIQETLITGYAMRMTFDEEFGVYTASLMGVDPALDNAGLMIYGNAETLLDAVACLMFKHEVLSSWGKWSGSRPAGKARFS